MRHNLPVVHELDPQWDVQWCVSRLQHLSHLLVLESSQRNSSLGRYSWVMADPVAWLTPSSMLDLKNRIGALATPAVEGLPPMQGGLAGLVSYEYSRSLEKVPHKANRSGPRLPRLAFGLYDVVVAFDHVLERVWLVSQGVTSGAHGELAGENPDSRRRRAEQRADFFLGHLNALPPSVATPTPSKVSKPASPSRSHAPVSNFSPEEYLKAVERCIEYIRAGDIFQVNLSQQMEVIAQGSALDLFRRMGKKNRSTFSGFVDLGEAQIVSASPERFVSVRSDIVETRPIKGTRKRTGRPQIDITTSLQLMASEKDRSENIMIVDLMRNDLSRVCTDESVEVTQLCGLEKYEYVFHLVSAVTGRLRPGLDVFDLVNASFPGGSVTGAPKVRAMEIISELEPHERGAYCGSLGWIGLNGDADFNILIRTVTCSGGRWIFPVGGGIVAQSDPQLELEETYAKATGLLRAIVDDTTSVEP